MSILHGVVEQTCSNESCRVSHIDHEQSTNLVGNLTHALVVPLTTVSRSATDDELRLVLKSQLFHLVVVDASGLAVQVVANGVVENTTCVHMRTVRQVASVIEVHAHERVAGFQHR